MTMRHLMVGIASLGGLIFGYETGIAAGALDRGQSAWLSTATLIGAIIGALAAGRVADLVGRRDVIMATAALFDLRRICECYRAVGTGAPDWRTGRRIWRGGHLGCRPAVYRRDRAHCPPRLADLHLPADDHDRHPARIHRPRDVPGRRPLAIPFGCRCGPRPDLERAGPAVGRIAGVAATHGR